MKKIMKLIAFLAFMLGSANIFAVEIIGPKHRIEGNLAIGIRFSNGNGMTGGGGGSGSGGSTSGTGIQRWTEYNGLTAVYRPEWTTPVNDLLSITFGPSIHLGAQLNIDTKNQQKQESGLYGFEGGIGGEVDFNFQIPDSEIVYVGLDYVFKGLGYIDFNSGVKSKSKGFQTGIGLSVGGKVSEKIKLGVRLGYEYKHFWEDSNGAKGQHIMPLSINFGYILGE